MDALVYINCITNSFFFYLQHLDQLVGRQTWFSARSPVSTTRMTTKAATTKATVTAAATAMTVTVSMVPSDTVTTAETEAVVPCDVGKLIVVSYFFQTFSEYNPYIKMHTTTNKMTIYWYFFFLSEHLQ